VRDELVGDQAIRVVIPTFRSGKLKFGYFVWMLLHNSLSRNNVFIGG